jgi:hypothetical protein
VPEKRFSGMLETPMADEKNSSNKNIVLWIITVALVGLAIFIYSRGR